MAKNRYISLVPGNPGEPTALRVSLVSLDLFDSFDGQTRWVGEPGTYDDTEETFQAAPLQCAPHYMDWSTVGVVHVYGAEIVPSSLPHL